MVWVNVTMAPRKIACFGVPCVPTRYAATIVLPWPGDMAWMAPSPKATANPISIMLKGISPWCSKRERKSPRTTAPGPVWPGCSAVAAVWMMGTGAVSVTAGAAKRHSTAARKSCGGATCGSCG